MCPKDDDTVEWQTHTCGKFQKGIREIFLSFQGGLWKMYGIYLGKLLIQMKILTFLWEVVCFRRNFWAHFRESPWRSGRVHMYANNVYKTLAVYTVCGDLSVQMLRINMVIVSFFTASPDIIRNWASSWEKSTCHKGDQRRLCRSSPEPSLFAHTIYGTRQNFR